MNQRVPGRVAIFANRGLPWLIVFAVFVVLSSAFRLLSHTVIAEIDPALDERPPMFVLQVGIGKYLNAPKWTELRGSRTDVLEMRKLLEGVRYNVPKNNLITLLDEQGTKKHIFDGFQNHLIAKAREHFERTKRRDAVVLFQFSGHGSQVPDVDGDEQDKLDETFVTHDSQDVQGRNFDITDDEIYALTRELRQYTDNIVYILDSCHSGSGTRDADEVRRLPARTTIPEPVLGLATQTRSGEKKAGDNFQSDLLPPSDDYIVITAASADQLASQKFCFEECGDSKTPVVYGYLTYYLIDELRNARNDTSYRELMENVSRKVLSEKPSQMPQIEGNKKRLVFGGLGRFEDNFTPVLDGGLTSIRINAGAMQGVSPGTIISVYDKAVTRFDEAEKIASATVVKVLPGESTARLINPKREITAEDKSLIVAPDIGALRLKVFLEADAAKLSAPDSKVIQSVRKSLTPKRTGEKEPRGVDLVNIRAGQLKTASWDVALLTDKIEKVFPYAIGDPTIFRGCFDPSRTVADVSQTTATRNVFYLAGKDFVPLYGFCVKSDYADDAAQAAAASEIERALVHLARLKNIRAIGNSRSRLKGKVSVKPVRLIAPYECRDGKLVAGRFEPAETSPITGLYDFLPGEVFWFEVVNNSNKDLYITLLNMPPDGSVKVPFPRPIDPEQKGVVIPANGGRRIVMGDDCRNGETGAFQTKPPFGRDTFKFIATVDPTKRDDFAYLEMVPLTRSGGTSLAGMSDWITLDLTLEVSGGK